MQYDPHILLLLSGLAVVVAGLVWWEERELTRKPDRWVGRKRK